MDNKRLHWSLTGVTIRRAEVKDDRITLHLNSGRTLIVSAAGFLNIAYLPTDDLEAA